MIEIKTHVALFAGLGGFILATEKLGIKTILANEIDENCRKTLKNNFPKLKIEKKDMQTFFSKPSQKNIEYVISLFNKKSYISTFIYYFHQLC